MEADLEHERFSTAISNKCFICNCNTGVSKRNSISIFLQHMTSSKRSLVKVIGDVLGEKISPNNLHSFVVCRQCYKSLNEAEKINERLADIKLHLNTQFQNTLLKSKFKNLHKQTIDTTTNNHESDSPKSVKKQKYSKILDESISIPMSNSITMENTNLGKFLLIRNEFRISEMLRDHKDNIEGNKKLVQPINIIHDPNLRYNENVKSIENIKKEDDDNGITNFTIPVDKNVCIENNETKNDGKSSSSNYYIKKKSSNLLIPQTFVLHTGEVYTCMLCSVENKFKSDANGFTIHAKNVHHINVFICEICGQVFVKRSELFEHSKYHNENYKLICNICNEQFTNDQKFRLHTKLHISQLKNYICETCGLQFMSLNTLEEHNNTHEILHLCEVCGIAIKSKRILREHLKVHASDDAHTMSFMDHCENGEDVIDDRNIEYITVTFDYQEDD